MTTFFLGFLMKNNSYILQMYTILLSHTLDRYEDIYWKLSGKKEIKNENKPRENKSREGTWDERKPRVPACPAFIVQKMLKNPGTHVRSCLWSFFWHWCQWRMPPQTCDHPFFINLKFSNYIIILDYINP